jgi:hypothetical protein
MQRARLELPDELQQRLELIARLPTTPPAVGSARPLHPHGERGAGCSGDRPPSSAPSPHRAQVDDQDPAPAQDPGDAHVGDPKAELESLALNLLVVPAGILTSEAKDPVGDPGREVGGADGRLRSAADLGRTWRCQRRRVSGVGSRADQADFGRSRLRAARTRRSPTASVLSRACAPERRVDRGGPLPQLGAGASERARTAALGEEAGKSVARLRSMSGIMLGQPSCHAEEAASVLSRVMANRVREAKLTREGRYGTITA